MCYSIAPTEARLMFTTDDDYNLMTYMSVLLEALPLSRTMQGGIGREPFRLQSVQRSPR